MNNEEEKKEEGNVMKNIQMEKSLSCALQLTHEIHFMTAAVSGKMKEKYGKKYQQLD